MLSASACGGMTRICFTSCMATVSQPQREGYQAWRTHEVFNQVPPLQDVDVYSSNLPLVEATEREGAGWIGGRASELGRFVGGEPQQPWGRLATENGPVLRTHDRYGNRIDEVEFHPAWHELMQVAVAHGVHSLAWEEDREGAHVARAALMFLDSQCEQGHGCPISMTYSAVPALRRQPELAREWEPRAVSRSYDPRPIR